MLARTWLLIRGVDACLWSHQLTAGRLTLGRSPACDIRLLHVTVSRRHAEVRVWDDGFSIRDLGSSNGTLVNGHFITDAAFDVGDTLRLGSVSIDVMASPKTLTATVNTALAPPDGASDSEAALDDLRVIYRLSPAEHEVLRLLLQGLSEKAAAAKLHLSRHTIHAHTKRIYLAAGVHSAPNCSPPARVRRATEAPRRQLRPLTG